MSKYFILILALFLFMSTMLVFAGPTVIEDNRVTDTATTPVLGRGYSISTNTFQSSCLQKVTTTKPSYDFKYTFESIDETKMSSKKIDSTTEVDASYWWIKAHVKAHVDQTKQTNKKYKHMVVALTMKTYYASVDESNSPLSNSAIQLLKTKDLIGFFSSCGAYYVRSIGRYSKYVSIFTYESDTEKSDKKFEISLKVKMRGFFGHANVKEDISGSFHNETSKRNLTITSRAYGMGKDKKATLISYDLHSFKKAIKYAFESMQNIMTGKVRSVEVVPWVENTEFQTHIDLHDVVKDKDGNDMLLYEKKLILNTNAEFIAEMSRADRNMMNIYYKAKLCKQYIEDNWMEKGKFRQQYQGAILRNNRGGPTETLSAVYNVLNQGNGTYIVGLLNAERTFMYGADKKSGATKCMRDTMNAGIFKVFYNEISSCQNIYQQMGAQESDIVDNYCMPTIHR